MRVERAREATPELVEALERLLPQLSGGRTATREEVDGLVAAPGVTLFVARDHGGAIVGTLTLVLYGAATALRGLIEDVVVDAAARGGGAGEALVRTALESAAAEGARLVWLTSRREREAANRLYARLGFERRETNVYRWRP